MTEKVLNKNRNGMAMLLFLIGCIIGSIALFILAVAYGPAFVAVLSLILLFASVVCLGGLKILKPQEALVLTLFGKYVGTLKGEGFYCVNPF